MVQRTLPQPETFPPCTRLQVFYLFQLPCYSLSTLLNKHIIHRAILNSTQVHIMRFVCLSSVPAYASFAHICLEKEEVEGRGGGRLAKNRAITRMGQCSGALHILKTFVSVEHFECGATGGAPEKRHLYCTLSVRQPRCAFCAFFCDLVYYICVTEKSEKKEPRSAHHSVHPFHMRPTDDNTLDAINTSRMEDGRKAARQACANAKYQTICIY